jgi:hypothetical protein
MPGALALGGPGPRRMSSARGPGPPPGRLGEVAVPVCDWAEGEGEGGGETADDGADACDTPAQADGCANTQPAFACYLQSREHAGALPARLVVLTIAGNHLTAITRFLDTSGEGRDPLRRGVLTGQAPGTGSQGAVSGRNGRHTAGSWTVRPFRDGRSAWLES